MGPGSVDLFAANFWITFAVALVVLVPLARPAARKWAWAAINLGFLALLLREQVVAAGVALVAVRLYLGQLGRGRGVRGLAAAGGVALLALFLIHKLPHASAGLGTARINPILASVGFSYVALRLIDVARAVAEGRRPVPDFPATVNYLLPFHMLAAGPIQAYDDFADQPPVPPAIDAAQALVGTERIVLGMFKKFVLANTLEQVFLTNFRAGGPYFLLEIQLNYVWLYLDFSAYSDIAVGIGTLLGVATPENFDHPFRARNLINYWDRWHISLSLFIRRNVFIPLQLALVRRSGGRRPLLVASVVFLVSFLLCGLWHAVDVRWLAWGLMHGLGLAACNAYRAFLMKRLGRRGVDRYLAIPWIRALAMALTFEYAALAVMVATYPLRPWPY